MNLKCSVQKCIPFHCHTELRGMQVCISTLYKYHTCFGCRNCLQGFDRQKQTFGLVKRKSCKNVKIKLLYIKP